MLSPICVFIFILGRIVSNKAENRKIPEAMHGSFTTQLIHLLFSVTQFVVFGSVNKLYQSAIHVVIPYSKPASTTSFHAVSMQNSLCELIYILSLI